MKLRELIPGLFEGNLEISSRNAHEVFEQIYENYKYHFLMESKQVSLFSGRFSLIGVDPAIKISGKNNSFEIELLNERANYYLEQISDNDFDICTAFQRSETKISGTIQKEYNSADERLRSKAKNISQVIRLFLNKVKLEDKSLLGFYGAFSYDFVRLFENVEDKLPENDVNDFTLFLYDTFIVFDHISKKNSIILFRSSEDEAKLAIADLEKETTAEQKESAEYKISDYNFAIAKSGFEEMVNTAKEYIREGEIFQVVFSNILRAKFAGSPLALYLEYREKNPSPYMFYYEFGDEILVGASPEMMVRYEDGLVHYRPIAGTMRRGVDPFDDHDQQLKLLNDEKERAELDMLIDLGRNDLARICKPGIKVDDYRFVEKYSRVMHTVAHLSGELKNDYTGLDALIACMNAGTLTGAPKIAAMKIIEKHEKERRAYYGGALGQLAFSGEVDTCILIRTVQLKMMNLDTNRVRE